jgi:O-antigen ligase
MLVPLTPLLNTLPFLKQDFFYFSDIIILSLIGIGIINFLSPKGNRPVTTEIDLPLLGYSLIACLSVMVSLFSQGDAVGNLRLLKIIFESYFVYYITVVFLASRKDFADNLIFATLIASLIISGLAIYQFFRSGSIPGSIFNDSEMLSIYLTLILPLIFGFLIYGYDGTGKMFAGIVFSLGCLSLFLSFFRAGWISGALTLSILGLCRLFGGNKHSVKSRGSGTGKRVAVFLSILFASGLLYWLWYHHIHATTRDAFYLRFMSIFSDHTFGGRVDLWEVALQLIQGSPLLGHGPTVNVYNLYLQVAAQFGLVALILFLFVFMKFFGVTLGRLKNIKSSREFGVVMGGALGVLGMLIVGMAESSLGSRMSPLFWMQVGMVMALQRKE